MIYHGGGDVGYRTNFVMLPRKNIAVVVLSNCDFAPVGNITNAALNVMLGIKSTKPKTPIHFEIGKSIVEKSIESAIQQYHDLQSKHSEDYGAH